MKYHPNRALVIVLAILLFGFIMIAPRRTDCRAELIERGPEDRLFCSSYCQSVGGTLLEMQAGGHQCPAPPPTCYCAIISASIVDME